MPDRVALVSSERGLRVDPDLPLASAALREVGLTADLVRWDDPDVDWDGYALSVVRSCWDYAWRRAEFLDWADRTPRLHNAPAVLRWNTDKTHLRDLEAAGVPVVPTVWAPTSVAELPVAGEWVVKPSVSAGSRDTARWSDPGAALRHAAELAAAGRTAMVQPYLPSVDSDGETAVLVIGGEFSHAVRKGPLLVRGEGVRQDRDSRGDLRPVAADPAQQALVRSVLDTVAGMSPAARRLLYARVDLVRDVGGRWVVLELELTEPSLFLPQAPEAAGRFARAVAEALPDPPT